MTFSTALRKGNVLIHFVLKYYCCMGKGVTSCSANVQDSSTLDDFCDVIYVIMFLR